MSAHAQSCVHKCGAHEHQAVRAAAAWTKNILWLGENSLNVVGEEDQLWHSLLVITRL